MFAMVVMRPPCLPQQDPGIIPRLCGGLFEAIKALGPGKAVTVIASYVEVLRLDIARSSNGSSVRPSQLFVLKGKEGEGEGVLEETPHPFVAQKRKARAEYSLSTPLFFQILLSSVENSQPIVRLPFPAPPCRV